MQDSKKQFLFDEEGVTSIVFKRKRVGALRQRSTGKILQSIKFEDWKVVQRELAPEVASDLEYTTVWSLEAVYIEGETL
jgi:hypothetical protein